MCTVYFTGNDGYYGIIGTVSPSAKEFPCDSTFYAIKNELPVATTDNHNFTQWLLGPRGEPALNQHGVIPIYNSGKIVSYAPNYIKIDGYKGKTLYPSYSCKAYSGPTQCANADLTTDQMTCTRSCQAKPECGSNNGETLNSIPTNNLCSTGHGNVSSFEENNQGYTWECSNGITTVSCSASKPGYTLEIYLPGKHSIYFCKTIYPGDNAQTIISSLAKGGLCYNKIKYTRTIGDNDKPMSYIATYVTGDVSYYNGKFTTGTCTSDTAGFTMKTTECSKPVNISPSKNCLMASSNCTWQENTDLLVTCESITMPGYNTRYTQRITECINREYLTQNASALRYTPYDGYDYKAAAVCSFQGPNYLVSANDSNFYNYQHYKDAFLNTSCTNGSTDYTFGGCEVGRDVNNGGYYIKRHVFTCK